MLGMDCQPRCQSWTWQETLLVNIVTTIWYPHMTLYIKLNKKFLSNSGCICSVQWPYGAGAYPVAQHRWLMFPFSGSSAECCWGGKAHPPWSWLSPLSLSRDLVPNRVSCPWYKGDTAQESWRWTGVEEWEIDRTALVWPTVKMIIQDLFFSWVYMLNCFLLWYLWEVQDTEWRDSDSWCCLGKCIQWAVLLLVWSWTRFRS